MSIKNRYSTPERQVPDCQDWTTVTMSKTKRHSSTSTSTSTSGTSAPSQSSSNSASSVVAAITKPIGSGTEDDQKKTKYIAKVTSDAVRVSRCEKKLTQKELAQKCNMDVSIISEIEKGGCVYNPTHVNKIQSILGVKIPRS